MQNAAAGDRGGVFASSGPGTARSRHRRTFDGMDWRRLGG
jgi:hypothetical protein